jgi:hypothetical protein
MNENEIGRIIFGEAVMKDGIYRIINGTIQ